jgi:hypothetical protein
MADFDIDGSKFFAHLDLTDKRVIKAMYDGMQDAVDDLKRISTDIAPVDTGLLRASGKTEIKPKTLGVVGEVTFNAVENSSGYGRFNYALWTHEADYNLGEQSKASPGTDGYSVGNKYLERPLKGESQKYLRWWRENIEKALD